MSQAQPLPRNNGRPAVGKTQRVRAGKARLELPFSEEPTSPANDDRTSRPQRELAAKARPRKSRRLPLVPFGLGLVIGAALAGPIPQLLGPLLAGLQQSSQLLGSVVSPPYGGRILVMGTDQVATNTDVIFTAQVKEGRTELTQVPRDTYIESDAYGVLKANALYGAGGMPAVEQELGKLLGEPLERYMIVNLDAVQHLGDALGGVEVEVPKRMYYTDSRQGLSIDLYPGRQLLKGKDLEGFLRFRHDEMGDLGRMERQRLVLAEVFRKLAQPSALAQLPQLLQIAGKDIKTNLSPGELGGLLGALRTTKLASSRLAGQPFWHDNLSYWMPDLNPNHAAYRSQEPPL
ncbi:LCP family protein [Cyanobium sp. Morenito 9A2]|nr:LCP family protein [Cyanobium sp. Morenito 9A2]MCP9850323.1 LCP family protein [Cyanobium sp. Morenito 9A2]